MLSQKAQIAQLSVGTCSEMILKFSLLFLALQFISWSLPAYSETREASFENNILSIPVVAVGEETYNLELLLTQDGANIDFSIVGAEKIQVVDTSGASVFDGSALLVPKVGIGSANYTLTLSVVNVDPPKFRLTDYAELKSVAEVPLPEPEPEPEPPKAPKVSLTERISSLYAETISSQIVMRRCVACHVQGGARTTDSSAQGKGMARARARGMASSRPER